MAIIQTLGARQCAKTYIIHIISFNPYNSIKGLIIISCYYLILLRRNYGLEKLYNSPK